MNLDFLKLSDARRWAAHPWARRALILALLLGAFLLRAAALGPMSTAMLHYDEAYNAVDSLNLLREFRLTPFLPGNFGRESGWVDWLMPFLLALGRGAFAVRVAALMTGFLTVVAAYRLGRELFPTGPGERVGIWMMGSLGALYWHVHLSHLALRANLYLLVAATATAILVRAYRGNRYVLWGVGGTLMGLLAYTYFASVAWMGYLGLILIGVVVVDRGRRRGAMLALVCALVVVLPMGLYAQAHPEQVLERSTTVSAFSFGALINNAHTWARALLRSGDPNILFNLPERPILDPILGLMAIAGLVGLVANRRWRVPGLLVGGLGVVALAPSLLSNFAPHFLRGSGLVIPLSVLLGMGGAAIASLVMGLGWAAESRVLPVVLLVSVGVVTARDFHSRWLTHPETFKVMEVPLNQSANLMAEATSPETSIYFSPFTPAHPVVILRSQDLAPRPTSGFNSHECWVVPDGEAAYMSMTVYEPSFAETLRQWADVTLLYADDTPLAPRPRYSVFHALPRPLDTGKPPAQFGDQFEVRTLAPLPADVRPGAVITLTVAVRALRPPEVAPSLFVHLYTVPTPYEGGTMVAQADSQLCTSYPAHLWRQDEQVIQRFVLPVPADAAAGPHVIGMGLYPFPDGARLPVVAPAESVHDYVALHDLTVLP